jgi:uncharacterized protein (DUF2062 family)
MRRLWHERVVVPLKDLLRQGLTPKKIALALAVGVAIGVFPVMGTTTILGLAAASLLRLNLPALQLANWVIYPVQIAMIVPLARLGEWLTGSPPVSFSVTEVVARTMADPLGSLGLYGMTGLHGILGWITTAPLLVLMLYGVFLPSLRGIEVRVRSWPREGLAAAPGAPLGTEAEAP